MHFQVTLFVISVTDCWVVLLLLLSLYSIDLFSCKAASVFIINLLTYLLTVGIVLFFLIGLCCNMVINGARMTLWHRAATHSTANTDVASDEDSNGENYIIYEHPGLASVREVMLQAYILARQIVVNFVIYAGRDKSMNEWMKVQWFKVRSKTN